MKSFSQYIFRFFLSVTVLSTVTLTVSAQREALITNSNQITVSNIANIDDVKNLIDGDFYSVVEIWKADNKEKELAEECYIEVKLNESLSLGDDKDLVVGITRSNVNVYYPHPTTFRVQGSTEETGDNWEDWDEDKKTCHIYFLYRGNWTTDYSTRIHTSKAFKRLRFTVTANSARLHDSKGHRYMGLAEFQIYQIGRNEHYSDQLVDRFHLTSDYLKKLKDYQFENTKGILESYNRQIGDRRPGSIEEWCSDWTSRWVDGKWQLYEDEKQALAAAGIINLRMPEYTMLTHENDGGYDYKPDAGQQRQPTHVTEHILYAIPGDAIALYPYYSFFAGQYETNFAHWYDYKSGGHLTTKDATTGKDTRMLDFLVDPSGVAISEQYGYYGGEALAQELQEIHNADEYIAFANAARSRAGASKASAQIVADLDFTGKDNVPTLGDFYAGTLEGNGHRISNLVMSYPDEDHVSLVGSGADGTVIRNLIIDETCRFIGKDKVAAVMGYKRGGAGVTIENVQVYAHVEAKAEDGHAAAIIGYKDENDPGVMINNCFVGGTIEAPYAAAVAIKTNGNNDLTIQNTVSVVEGIERFVISPENATTISNCYGNSTTGVTPLPDDLNSEEFRALLGNGWQLGTDEIDHIVPVVVEKIVNNNNDYGKVATFFCPRTPYAEDGVLQQLPFKEGEKEFVIAADFSQSFDRNNNIDYDTQTIKEPIIQFRHIFRIRDGKDFAEDFSGSVAQNQAYIKRNIRRVSARANVPFQIRLDSPIPIKGDNTPRSKYYYKISDTDYRRVCTMNIEVKDVQTGAVIHRTTTNGGTTINAGFYYGGSDDEKFNGYGSRDFYEFLQKNATETSTIGYKICGGGGAYYRMLKWDMPKEGTYLIRITGNDINGNPIKVYDPATKDLSDEDLVVMEMQLTVLPESAASMVDEKTLYGDAKYAHAQEEVLEKNYGKPKQTLNFDEYMALENVDHASDYLEMDGDKKEKKLKWPMPWNDVTYAFDYDQFRDYNMYSVVSHSNKVRFRGAVENHVNEDKTKGLYDRLYYKTWRQSGGKEKKYGYFYYVNASADPGVMARLTLNGLCMGSTIHVSAWVAEFSAIKDNTNNEPANISFNFIAVLKDEAAQKRGEQRVQLHSFISGYVPLDGERDWMNIYYSFVPNYTDTGIGPDDVDHYELELDNNCKNSKGADYAIDNIRLYVASPTINAVQNEPLCDEKNVAVRVEAPFDVLLQVVGETEKTSAGDDGTGDASTTGEGTVKTLYYTFIDKALFDAEYEKPENSDRPGEKAYQAAVQKYDYQNGGGEGNGTFGMVKFSTRFEENVEYNQYNEDYKNETPEIKKRTFYRIDSNGTRLIGFNTRPYFEQLVPGKEYYLSVYLPFEDDTKNNPGWNEFDMKGQCPRVCVFKVKPSSTIKVDGVLIEDTENINCCENQAPVIQVDMWGKDKDDEEVQPIVKNARLDWYSGSYVDYQNEKLGDTSLSDILTLFRTAYPETDNCDVEAIGDLTVEMIAYLKGLTETIPEGSSIPKLQLSQTSFVFPPVPGASAHVLAIPIRDSEDDGVLLCANPTEVSIKTEQVAPALRHGLTQISYPEAIIDVPLRIGLKQLKAVSAPEAPVMSGYQAQLQIPVRSVKKGHESVTEMVTKINNPLVFLAETNDPGYSDLGTLDENQEDKGTLMAVGEITGLTAKVGENIPGNLFNIVFYDSFKFKEGYYYRLRFNFAEKDPNADDATICDGQEVFTIKVVPEFQRWTGAASKNWNNDRNWTRVKSTELYLTDERKAELAAFVTDGEADGVVVNGREQSYAPLEFTKVIMPSMLKEEGSELHVEPSYLDAYTAEGAKQTFTFNNDIKEVTWVKEPSTTEAGKATDNIQYDMAAYTITDFIKCRPWYANTCEQIHFKPHSEITGQENLTYQKAWVDIATKPGRWYTLATPLKTVFAGDMYLPSATARQETELFQEMTYNKDNNDRFKPAVYQRSWNRAEANVYELGNGNNSRNVAVMANWSHVYNDVTEAYGSGTGFSIKTDLDKMDKEAKRPEEVLFRLPKSDTSYDYYTEDGSQQGNTTTIARQDNFRLNDAKGTIKAVSRGGNRYFLVGNPFMAHLDMVKFLEKNQDQINQKYWILTEGSQGAAVFDKTDGLVGDSEGKVAPLQSFFVEVTDAAANTKELELAYTADMACAGFATDNVTLLRAATRSSAHQGVISISAKRDDQVLSQAFIHLSPHADKAYREVDDAILIDHSQLEIPATVYTVSGKTALAVNTTNDIEGTEIGLIAEDGKETQLVFEGVESLSDVLLYDAGTHNCTPLYEGMEYVVKGTTAGRLYLLSSRSNIESSLQAMKVEVAGRHVRIASGTGSSIAVKVYTAEGMEVLDRAEETRVMELRLDKGLYILEVTDGDETIKRKILIP